MELIEGTGVYIGGLKMKPTKKQMNAINKVEKAFKDCFEAGVYFHNCYGKLIAYDGAVVKEVNDTRSEIPCGEGYELKISERLDSWADDLHYVHFSRRCD